MIGGINPSNPSLYQAGNNSPARERTDVFRTPAADPQALATGDVRNPVVPARTWTAGVSKPGARRKMPGLNVSAQMNCRFLPPARCRLLPALPLPDRSLRAAAC